MGHKSESQIIQKRRAMTTTTTTEVTAKKIENSTTKTHATKWNEKWNTLYLAIVRNYGAAAAAAVATTTTKTALSCQQRRRRRTKDNVDKPKPKLYRNDAITLRRGSWRRLRRRRWRWPPCVSSPTPNTGLSILACRVRECCKNS